MFQSKFPRKASVSARSVASLICVGLLLTAAGCKKATKSKPSDTPAAVSGAAASGAVAAGKSCEELSKKACGVAGEKSGTCTSVKLVADMLTDTVCAAGLKDFAHMEQKIKGQASKCDELVEKLCAGVGKETDTCKMVAGKTKEFPPEQCMGMLEHVDEIVSDLKKQEAANQPLTAEQAAKVAAGDVPAFGPADAKVTLVEFSDFQCPYCSRAASVTSQIKAKYGTKVRFVFRQYPLSFHDNAQVAAEASLEAYKQGKFWEFHDKMFANQNSLDRASLEGYAKELKLDMAKFKGALDTNAHSSQVKADLDLGNEVAVQGTPTLFLNGKRIDNPTDFDQVSRAIDEVLGS